LVFCFFFFVLPFYAPPFGRGWFKSRETCTDSAIAAGLTGFLCLTGLNILSVDPYKYLVFFLRHPSTGLGSLRCHGVCIARR
jgi:hypothetical protein